MELFCGLLVVAGIIVLLVWANNTKPRGTSAGVKVTENKPKSTAMDAARMIIRQHAEALRVKRLQKRRHDDYGNVIDDKWWKEKEYFYDNVITRS